ncbi:MAG TPA: cytochrome P450, partial [Polyangiales bacterium]|nr:cytochrome P450 [Polyangiales bacterium]
MDGNLVGLGDNPELAVELDDAPLDVSALDKPTAKEVFLALCWRPEVFRVLRAVRPVLRLGGFVFLTRHDDVRTLLEHDREFHVEGRRIHKANGGHDFVLGMQDDKRCPFRQLQAAEQANPPSYRDYQRWVMQHFPLEDLTTLRTLMREVAERAVGQGGYVDAASGLITHVAIAVCRDYYGVDVPRDKESDFANTTFAVSRWLFDPEKSSRFDRLGGHASDRLRRMIYRSIASAARDSRDTVIRRLMQAGVPSPQICTIIFGMISGFVPTSTMATGHILQVLLSRRDAYEASRAAALAQDDVRLERCLFEAMRFKPLVREPLRVCQEPFTFSESSRWKGSVRPEDRIIAITASAMMDEAAFPDPERFDPDRAIPHSLLYGAGMHRCIGAPIASLHAVESLRALLRAGDLRKIE